MPRVGRNTQKPLHELLQLYVIDGFDQHIVQPFTQPLLAFVIQYVGGDRDDGSVPSCR